MKPFNLEEAKAGKLLITRSGLKIKEYHYFEKTDMIAAISEKDNCIFTNGKGMYLANIDSPFDLCMDEEKTVEYRNVYEMEDDGTYLQTNESFDSIEECMKRNLSAIGVIEITKIDGKIKNIQSVHIY